MSTKTSTNFYHCCHTKRECFQTYCDNEILYTVRYIQPEITHTKEIQCDWEWALIEQSLRGKNDTQKSSSLRCCAKETQIQTLCTHTHPAFTHLLTHTHIESKITKENYPYRFLPILSLSIWIHCYGKLYEIENEWLCLFWGCSCFFRSLFLPRTHTHAHAATCTHCSVYSFDYFYLGFVISYAIVPKQFKLNRQPYSNKINWQRTTHERPIEHTSHI